MSDGRGDVQRQLDEPTASLAREGHGLDLRIRRDRPVQPHPQRAVEALEMQLRPLEAVAVHVGHAEGVEACLRTEAGEAGRPPGLHPPEEAVHRIVETAERPAAHRMRQGRMRRVEGADRRQRCGLVLLADRPPVQPPGVATLLQRGVVESALQSQHLDHAAVLRTAQVEEMTMHEDHIERAITFDMTWLPHRIFQIAEQEDRRSWRP